MIWEFWEAASPHILLGPWGPGQARAGCGQGSALPSIGTNTAVSPPPGVPMGVLSCMKYLMFIFNVLVFVSPPGPRGVQGWREPVPGEQHLQLAQGWVTPVPGRGPRVQASPIHMG